MFNRKESVVGSEKIPLFYLYVLQSRLNMYKRERVVDEDEGIEGGKDRIPGRLGSH